VRIRGLRKSYGQRAVFAGLDLDISEGVMGILGPNGAGKTTLLRCLATAHAPDGGSLAVLGLDVTDPGMLPRIRRNIGYLPQKPGLYPHFDVREMLDYVAILKLIADPRERAAEVHRVLELVDLSGRADTKVRKLSGGMRQRLGIAAALLGTPKVLVLDEPTVGLDPEQRMEFRAIVSRVGESAAVILSTHQTEDVAALCERVVVFEAGRVIFDGPPRDVADLALGQVWLSDERPAGSARYWRTADGRYRSIGERPQGAQPASVAVEDGYLLLLSRTKGAAE
jgi:ABC-2 type transport system ATP-binding protein